MKLTAENCQKMLVDNILPFWINNMVDQQHGGFYGSMSGNGQLKKNSPKGIILNSRILWTFAAAYRQFGLEQYRSMASRAFDYLNKHFIDEELGGVYWMLDHTGAPLEVKKQVYAQAFAIYALSEFHEATNDQQSLVMAQEIYALIEKHSFDRVKNGYLEAFDRRWRLLDDLRLSDKDVNEAKTMNTHLHVLEAYTRLYQVWPDAGLSKQLENLINLFLKKFISPRNGFQLFFDEAWNLKSAVQSFGHDIEGGWLLLRAAEVLGNPELIDLCRQSSLDLTDAALKGMDQDGGLMYEGDASGIVNPEKHWWPQAEALVGLINAWQITGEAKYSLWAQKNWDFIQKHLVDTTGEWHWMVNRQGVVDHQEDKAGPWKAPYHNGRAMMELMERLSNIPISGKHYP